MWAFQNRTPNPTADLSKSEPLKPNLLILDDPSNSLSHHSLFFENFDGAASPRFAKGTSGSHEPPDLDAQK